MKLKNITYLLVLFIFFSCPSDDDAIIQDVVVEPSFSVDVNTIITLPAGTDISSIVDFGQGPGQTAADVESVVELNDLFLLGRPNGLASTDKFIYEDIIMKDETGDPVPVTDEPDGANIVGGLLQLAIPPGFTFPTVFDYYNTGEIEQVALRVIDADPTNDTNWKYDLEVSIESGGTLYGPFIIDPKLKIKPKG